MEWEVLYEAPMVEVIEVAVEKGFSNSSIGNENWNETPGGGGF